jgi:hypothetical protein
MLIKPMRPTDSGADVADYLTTHNGGQWAGNESSWQYKTILEWILGATLKDTETNTGGPLRRRAGHRTRTQLGLAPAW